MTDTATKSRSHKYTTREALLQPMLAHAAFDGWSATSFEAARKEAGISAGDAELACPRKELDLLAHWSRKLDDAVLDAVKAADLASMKIRERVRFGVMARLEALGEHEEAAVARAPACFCPMPPWKPRNCSGRRRTRSGARSATHPPM